MKVLIMSFMTETWCCIETNWVRTNMLLQLKTSLPKFSQTSHCLTLSRGDATGTAGRATGCTEFRRVRIHFSYFVSQKRHFVWFSSQHFCAIWEVSFTEVPFGKHKHGQSRQEYGISPFRFNYQQAHGCEVWMWGVWHPLEAVEVGLLVTFIFCCTRK